MVTILFNFWNNLNKTSKLLLIAVIFVSLWGLKQSYYKYKYFKGIEREHNELIKERDVLTAKIDSIALIPKQVAKRAKKQSISIDNKHKNDVKEIINSSVTDDELNGFITRHSN